VVASDMLHVRAELESEPLRFNYGERLRLVLVNDSMMHHPIHLHGMWSEVAHVPPDPPYGKSDPARHWVPDYPTLRLGCVFVTRCGGSLHPTLELFGRANSRVPQTACGNPAATRAMCSSSRAYAPGFSGNSRRFANPLNIGSCRHC
jgi:hypothetical protein